MRFPRRDKYGAKRTEDGYASKREAKRAGELRLLALAGEIADLREQVPFELVPAQRDAATGKVIERAITYVADFTYCDRAGALVVEDVKSTATASIERYVIKRKLMLWLHGIRIQEV